MEILKADKILFVNVPGSVYSSLARRHQLGQHSAQTYRAWKRGPADRE